MSSLIFSQSKTRNILIAYGSFSGSTKEIVDSMRTYLANDSTSVDIFSAEKTKIELSKYDMIIIGSAIHGNAPHPQILEFIDINRNELNSKMIAVFAVCGTITSTKKKKRENALNYPFKVSHGLNVCRKEVFAGNMPSSVKKSDDFMAKVFLGIVTGDFRDWNKIRNWTIETKNIIR
jgi:menaquinone-dependent protoporphyrinogen oxidase